MCTGKGCLQQQDMFLGLGGPMEAETMSLPPTKEYRSRLGVPGRELDRSRVPFVAAAIKVLFTCKPCSDLSMCMSHTYPLSVVQCCLVLPCRCATRVAPADAQAGLLGNILPFRYIANGLGQGMTSDGRALGCCSR